MKIKKIKIQNYRALSNVEANFEGGILSFIGQNDVGKSSVLYAIKSFFKDQSINKEDFHNNGCNPISIEIHFEVDGFDEYKDEGLIKLRKIYTINETRSRIEMKKEIYGKREIPSAQEVDELGVSELKKMVKCLNIDLDIEIKANTKGQVKEEIKKKLENIPSERWYVDDIFDEIKNVFPEIVYIPATYDYESQQRTSTETSAFGNLFRVGIKNSLEGNETYKNAEEIIQEEINNINKQLMKEVQQNLNSQINSDKHLIYKNNKLDIVKGYSFDVYVKDSNGNELPLSNNGSGLQRAAIIAVLRHQAKIKNPDSKIIYLFEEPEAFLHLKAQKELFYALKDLSNNSQIILTTHSTLFMDSSDIDQIVLLYRDKNGNTQSSQYIDEDDVKDELGEVVRISEIITGKMCCIVEGISDKNAFSCWLKTSGIDIRRNGIHIIPMDGCKNAVYYANAKILKDFNIPYVVILDTDSHSSGKSETIKNNLEQNIDKTLKHTERVIVLKGELENYYSLDKVSQVLKIDKKYIDTESYKIDPKKELENAKQRAIEYGVNGCRKYNENKHSKEISSSMTLEEINKFKEIVYIIDKIKECLD